MSVLCDVLALGFPHELICLQGYWLVFGGSGDAEPSEDLHLFDFATFSWSTAQQPLLQKPAGYLATCHQDRMVIMGGYGEGEVADLIQTICPRYRPPAEAEADSSSMRYELSNDLRESLQQREFTDLTIQVEGKRWEVHRVVLASCSPFFKQVMQCGPAPGTLHVFNHTQHRIMPDLQPMDTGSSVLQH